MIGSFLFVYQHIASFKEPDIHSSCSISSFSKIGSFKEPDIFISFEHDILGITAAPPWPLEAVGPIGDIIDLY